MLSELLTESPPSISFPEFPLDCSELNTLGAAMMQDLKTSWETYHRFPTMMLQPLSHGIGSSVRFVTPMSPDDVRLVVGDEVSCWRLETERIHM